MKKNKLDWLLRLRRCASLVTLEKVIEHNRYKRSDADPVSFNAAADHRLAEFMVHGLHAKLPDRGWTRVR